MASSPWDSDSERFWSQKESIVQRAARRGHHDPREAWGYIWEKLRKVFPNGLEGDRPVKDLDEVILRISYNHFNNEKRRCFRQARRTRSLNDGALGPDE